MAQDDFYKVLGIDADAGDREIKEAYRKLAFAYHPDRNTDAPDAAEKMKKVNEAYAVLSNPEKRRQYDALRRQFGSRAYSRFRQNYSEQDIFRGSDINAILDEMARAFGFSGADEVLREFYGSGYRSFEFKRPGFSARGYVFRGGFNSTEKQPAVGIPSKGVMGKLARLAAEKIGGVVLPEAGEDLTDDITVTPEFARSGGPYPYFHRQKKKKLVVKVPAGVREGQQIRLPGMGREGKGGAENGDLYLKINYRKPLLKKIKDALAGLKP